VFTEVTLQVAEREWDGFGPARNTALELAAPHCDWLLTLDADDTIHGELPDLGGVHADGMEATYRFAELAYAYTRLIRADAGWRWEGRAHEYLVLPDGRPPVLATTDSFYVEHHADGGSRAGKGERELELLEHDWADKRDSRSAFYLARTHDDMGSHVRAVAWYRRRVTLGGWDEEIFYSRWRLGACLLASGSVEEGRSALWHAWATRPWRAEPLLTLAEHYRIYGDHQLAWHALTLAGDTDPRDDRLFVHTDSYTWRLDYEISITAWWVGEHDAGAAALHRLDQVELPVWARVSVEANRGFYVAA
jgi:glycosyltransferase involved in cell wall biosynthesis